MAVRNKFKYGLLAFLVSAALSGCGLDGDDGAQGETGAQGPQGEQGEAGADGSDGTDASIGIAMDVVGRAFLGNQTAAEIVQFHAGTSTIYATNGETNTIAVIDASSVNTATMADPINTTTLTPTTIALPADINGVTLGSVTSIAISGDLMAVAVPANVKTDNGYVLFYNPSYFILNPLEIFKVWKGGMSFHGALIGIIFGTVLFASKKKVPTFFLLDIISCVAPIGIFFGRIANFINSELVGKVTNVPWGIIFPGIDNLYRHPSQLYEAFLEGIILFIILNLIMFKKKYRMGQCSYIFLIVYGIFRIISEIFREPDSQLGYLFDTLSMGSFLSILMIMSGLIIFFKKNEN